jgi:hypothetical protein
MPTASELVLIAIAGCAIVIANGRVADWFASSPARSTKSKRPGVVGVPDNAPAAESDTPDGSEPLATDHEYGSAPPLAFTAAL